MKVVLSFLSFIFCFTFCFTQASGAIRPGFFEISPRQTAVKPGATINLDYRVKNLDDETTPAECEPLRYFVQAPQGWLNLAPKKTNCLKPGETNGTSKEESALVTLTVPESAAAGDYIVSAEVVRDARAMKRFAYDAVVVRVSNCGPVDDLKVEHVSEAADGGASTRVTFTAGVPACRYIVESSENLTQWKVEEVFTSADDGDLFARSFGDSTVKKFFRVRFFDPLK